MAFGADDLAVGGLSAAGGIIGGLISAQNSRSNADHAFNQSMMARRTAHQDEVADLRAAGLNPVLSANGGATSPTATMSESPDMSGAVGTGINTALAHKRQKADLESMQLDNKLKGQMFSINSQDWENKYQTNHLLRSQTEAVKTNTEFQRLKNNLMTETLQAQIKEAKAKGDWAQVNMLLGAIGQSAAAIGNLASPIKLGIPTKKNNSFNLPEGL